MLIMIRQFFVDLCKYYHQVMENALMHHEFNPFSNVILIVGRTILSSAHLSCCQPR